MISVKYESGKPAEFSMKGNIEQLVTEGAMVVATIVHGLAHSINDETAESFLKLVRNMDDAGVFFTALKKGEQCDG